MKITMLACVLALAAIGSANATDAQNSHDKVDVADILIDAAAKEEERQRDIDLAMAPIRSEKELAHYLAKRPSDSALNLLSAGAQKRFLNSLTFNEKGLTSYNYRDLQVELTASQIYRVLSLFGTHRTTEIIPGLRIESDADRTITAPHGAAPRQLPDYQDRRCEGNSRCVEALGYACASSC